MLYQSGGTGQETIFIVDDVETNRLILEEIIKNMGCRPLLLENGEQALEAAHKVLPQLILTDISMPGMDGYELCRRLKEDERTRDIPVIFISAFDHPEDIVEGLSLGGEDYITKPFVPEVIEARVGVRLRLGEAKRELLEMNRRLQVSVSEQLKQMEQEKRNILYALGEIAAHHAGYQKNRVERMKRNCRILAQGMQLSPLFEDKISDAFVDTIELAVPLCDIGKIAISKEILQNKESLTEEEKGVLRTHTQIGAKFLTDLYMNSDYNDFVGAAIQMIRHHHENWDGSGYPDGLSKDEIPLMAQIAAVVEMFCTLTEDEGCSKDAALKQMKQNAGTKINPDIFEICCMISRQLC